MEISDVRVQRFERSRSVGLRSAVKEVAGTTSLVVTLETDTGLIGRGEASDIEQPAEIPDDAEIARRLRGPLVGRDPRRINALYDEVPDQLDFGPMAFHSFQQLLVAALDTACYDLVGKRYGAPAYQLLGGNTAPVTLSWVVFADDPEDYDGIRSEVQEKYDDGFRHFKLKVGEHGPEVDEARIRAVREVVGPDASVLLDAQGEWTIDTAIDRIDRFASIGIDGVETPVGHPDPDVDAPGYYYDKPLFPAELATVREAVDVPILEHVLDPSFGTALVRAHAVDVFTVEVCATGLTGTQRLLHLAQSAGLGARLGSTVEFGPGTLAAATLAAASPAVTHPSDLIGPLVYPDDVLAEPVRYGQGSLAPRDRPGLGFDVAFAD